METLLLLVRKGDYRSGRRGQRGGGTPVTTKLMRSAPCNWLSVALPAGVALDPDLGLSVELGAPADNFERLALPCLDADESRRLVTCYVVGRDGERRLFGQQDVWMGC